MPAISTVSDIVTELNGTGSGPYTIYDVAGVTSGVISEKITEADAFLRGMVGSGPSDSPASSIVREQAKRFEINYASAKLLASLIGIIVTDGFNFSLGGLDIQRVGAKFQVYEQQIRVRLDLSKQYIQMLHEWFITYKPDNDLGYTERGTPVQYWTTSNPRY